MNVGCLLDIGFTHHLDHLIPFADTFGMTVVVFTEEDYADANTYYPAPPVQHIPQTELATLTSFDVLVVTSNETGPYIRSLLGTACPPIVFLPHGQSDKGYSAPMNGIYTKRFVYGPRMERQLKEQGVACKATLQVGNFRKHYFEKHRHFFSLEKPKTKAIFYAPSWVDRERSTNPLVNRDIIDKLSESYSVYVKLHPFLERDFPGKYYSFAGNFEVVETPWIYPYLALSDYYLGDYSSVGYDALASGLPLTFLITEEEKKERTKQLLHRYGAFFDSEINTTSSIEAQKFVNDVFSRIPSRSEMYDFLTKLAISKSYTVL